MPKIRPDVPPMYYNSEQTIQWTADPDIAQMATTVNGLPPAISEYIAYDTLTPPNPFLAVTQDGNGNVIYDGGFPKFYNGTAPAAGTSFSGLTGSYKFMYNALNFIANSEKVAAGNRKVLLVGDSLLGQSYSVKGTTGSDFSISFTRICDIAGYQLTIKDASDWGGVIDFSYAELDEYCCVIVMASRSPDNFNVITNRAVQDIVTFREQGNGIAMITDHGPLLTSIEEAQLPHGGFFTLVNRIAVNFGAYFTGDFNRTPVNVGFLRTTYGDHPLYNGMTNAESISAGGSESKVVVTETPTFGPEYIPPTQLTTPGKHIVNFLGIKTNGDVVTYRYAYTIIEGEFLYPERMDRKSNTERGLATSRGVFDLSVHNTDSEFGTLLGRLYVNGMYVGEFEEDGDVGSRVEWVVPGLQGVSLREPVSMEIHLDAPIRYTTQHDITIDRPPLTPAYGLPASLEGLRTADAVGLEPEGMIDFLRVYKERHYGNTDHAGLTIASALQTYLDEQNALVNGDPSHHYPPLAFRIYSNSSALALARPSLPESVRFAMEAATGSMMIRDPIEGWVNYAGMAGTMIPYPRELKSTVDQNTYWFDGTNLTLQT